MSEEKISKGDFIEIDFTGKIKDGEVFDSTRKEDLEKIDSLNQDKAELQAKPFIFRMGHDMFMKPLENFLLGKEIGRHYDIELKPEDAFGKRNPSLINRVPSGVFKEQKLNPIPGVSLNFDGKIGKILAVSGGRVIVDFNHALAGKDVAYDIKVNRKVKDINEQIKALNDFFFRKDFRFSVDKAKKTLTLEVEPSFAKMAELFKDKYKEILGLDLVVKEVGERKEEKSN